MACCLGGGTAFLRPFCNMFIQYAKTAGGQDVRDPGHGCFLMELQKPYKTATKLALRCGGNTPLWLPTSGAAIAAIWNTYQVSYLDLEEAAGRSGFDARPEPALQGEAAGRSGFDARPELAPQVARWRGWWKRWPWTSWASRTPWTLERCLARMFGVALARDLIAWVCVYLHVGAKHIAFR